MSELWLAYQQQVAKEAGEAKQRMIEMEKRWKAEAEARRIKWATVPHQRVTADVITDGYVTGPARVIDDCESLTVDDLLEAIANGENEPVIVCDEDGTYHLMARKFRGLD